MKSVGQVRYLSNNHGSAGTLHALRTSCTARPASPGRPGGPCPPRGRPCRAGARATHPTAPARCRTAASAARVVACPPLNSSSAATAAPSAAPSLGTIAWHHRLAATGGVPRHLFCTARRCRRVSACLLCASYRVGTQRGRGAHVYGCRTRNDSTHASLRPSSYSTAHCSQQILHASHCRSRVPHTSSRTRTSSGYVAAADVALLWPNGEDPDGHAGAALLWLRRCGYTAMASCSTAVTMPRQCPFAL